MPLPNQPIDIDFDPAPDEDFDWESVLFKMPEPELHKILGSVCVHPSPRDELAEIFGEPKETKTGWKFKNGLWLSKYNKHYRYVVRFNADNDIFAGLHKVLKPYPPYWHGVLRAQIMNIEVNWTVPCPDKTDAELENILWAIAEVAMPKTNHVDLVKKAGKKKRVSRAIVNGRRTLYFKPTRVGRDKKYIFVKKPQWRLKIYLKEILGVRHIRFEVTLTKDYFDSKNLPKNIPLTTKPSWLERMKLEDFVDFAHIDWEKFGQKLHKRMRAAEEKLTLLGSRYKRVHPYRVRLAAGRGLPACRQKHAAYGIFKLIDKKRLQDDFKDGKFYTPINIFED